MSFNDACGIYSFSKTIVVGTSSASITGPSSLCPCTCCNWYSAINISGATYNWTITPSSGNSVAGMGNQAEVIITTPCTLKVELATPCGIISDSRHIFLKSPDQCHGGCSLLSSSVFPSPAQNTITVTSTSTTGTDKEEGLQSSVGNKKEVIVIKRVKIYNSLGKISKQQQYSGKLYKVQIDISDLHSVVYIVEISDGKYRENQKLVIAR